MRLWGRVLRVPRPIGRQASEDVDREIDFHLDARTEALVASGMDPERARKEAEREFGDVRAARSALVPKARRRERQRRFGRGLNELSGDVRQAVRSLRSAPAFTTVAVATLALAIGATTGIFSVANAVLFRPLPYFEPDRIVQVMEADLPLYPRNHISSATYIDWRNDNESFSEFGAYSFELGQVLTGTDALPQQIQTISLTPAAFRILGVPPLLGRQFLEEERQPGSPLVAVINWGLWQNRFGGDPDILGRFLTIDKQDWEIVGVMGPRFAFPNDGIDVWLSMRMADSSEGQNRTAHQWQALGRLGPGVSVERAKADLDAISGRLEQSFPEAMTDWRSHVEVFRADLTRSVRPLMWVLLTVVAAVLLVACANLANLMLARFTAKRREFALRSAIGAGRGRLIRKALVESSMLSLVGGGLGLVLAAGLMRLFVSMAPRDIPLLATTRLDTAVLVFAALVTVTCTVLFGLIPALRTTRVDPASVLQEGRRGSSGGRSHTRLRSAILVSQIALSSVLLIGAGLLTRSMIALQSVDYGFDIDNLSAATLGLPGPAYPTLVEQQALLEPLRERLAAISGVTAVGGTSEPPVIGYQMSFGYSVAGQPRLGPESMEDAIQLRVVTPDYFEAMRQPVVLGRSIERTDDTESARVAVINEALAALHWPGRSPIGERISTASQEGPWLEIVGVVADTRHLGPTEAEPVFFIPYAQKPWNWMGWQTFMIRADSPPSREAVESVLWEFDRSLVLERFTRVEDLYADSRATRRFAMQLMVTFAGLALLLGAIGLYGVLAYSVGQRRQEIGVRMALGADRGEIIGLVMRNGLVLAAGGLVIGVVAALLATRFLESLLFGVETRDALTFVTIPFVLLAVAALSSWIPARRAGGTEPATVLRQG